MIIGTGIMAAWAAFAPDRERKERRTMPMAAEILLDREMEVPRVTLQAENARLRLTIAAAVDRLGEIHGAGQDVEGMLAEVRDELAAAIGGEAAADDPPTLEEVEHRHIRRVLDRHEGYKPAAAKELGISLKTLYNKIHQMDELAAHAVRR